jgi:predicted nucleotidyltransferase
MVSPDPARQVPDLIDRVVAVKHLGTYLHGSAVHGGLRPASDLDLLVVTTDPLDAGERRALTDGLLAISGSRAGARPLEVTVVVRSQVCPWRYPPVADYLYGEWLREEFETSGPPRPAPMPNLAIEIPSVLAGDRALAGPPPGDLLDPVPPADVVRASLDAVPDLLDSLDGDTRNVVLTLARIWYTLATGGIGSKDQAATWALARLPERHRAVLEHARRLYRETSYRDETWSAALRAGVDAHVAAVLAEIRALDHR